VPLLIAEQAFASNRPLVVASELGLLVGSVVAFGVGAVLLLVVRRRIEWTRSLGEGAAGERDGPFIPW
jgi:Na+/H+ antiporter NhaA